MNTDQNLQFVTSRLSRVRYFLEKRHQAGIALLIFLACLFIYLANHDTLTSNDNIPHSLLAFNWLDKHTLHLDAFRNSHFYGPNGECLRCRGDSPYFFVEAPNGHLTSTYPIGTSIVTFPLYCLFYLWMKLNGVLQPLLTGQTLPVPDITSPDFNGIRLHYEKLAATIATAFSVTLFYLTTRLKFNTAVSLIATFIYGFATSSWVSSSQGLRQHTVSNLAVTALLFCILKANRTQGRVRRLILLAGGIFCGLLPGVRITSGVFAIAAVIYVIYTFRRDAIFLLLGCSSFLLNAAWNVYFFGFSPKSFIVGGYSRMAQGSFFSTYYSLTLQSFIDGCSGLLLSPNFGLFVFSPILIFGLIAIYQVYKLRVGRDEQFLLCMLLAALLLTLQYCVFTIWTGGTGSFGPRYMTDVLPVLCLFVPYFMVYHIEAPYQKSGTLLTRVSAVFLALLLFSTFVQVVGVFGRTNWGEVPISLGAQRSRVWDFRDSQIQRHTSSLFFKLVDPIHDPQDYHKGLGGIITQVSNLNGQPFPNPLAIRAGRQVLMQAALRNTGEHPWYGYQTGLAQGQTIVKAKFFQADDEEIKTGFRNSLFVSGTPNPGDTATALGTVAFPKQPGTYRLEFNLTTQGLGAFPKPVGYVPYSITVNVKGDQ